MKRRAARSLSLSITVAAKRPAALHLAPPLTRDFEHKAMGVQCPKKTKGNLKPFIGCKGVLFFNRGRAFLQMCHSGGRKGELIEVASPREASKVSAAYCAENRFRGHRRRRG